MSSFILRDALTPSMAVFNHRWKFYRVFNKVWPRSDDGYYTQLNFYTKDGGVPDYKEFNDFLNIIGMSRDDLINQDYDEVERAYFYLKQPDNCVLDDTFNSLDTVVPLTPQEVIEKMGEYAPKKNDVFKITFEYNGILNKRLPQDSYNKHETVYIHGSGSRIDSEYAMTKAEIIEYVLNNKPGLFVLQETDSVTANSKNIYVNTATEPDKEVKNSTKIEPYGKNKKKKRKKQDLPIISINTESKYGWYSLFDYNQENFEYIKYSNINGTENSFTFDVWFKVKNELDENSICISEFLTYFNEYIKDSRTSGILPYKITLDDYRSIYPPVSVSIRGYQDLWVDGRLNVVAASKISKKDFSKLIGESLESDAEPEDAEWWEKVLAIIIIIIAIIVTIFTLGTASAATLPVIATAFAYATGVLVIGGLVLSTVGGPSAQGLVKIIGNFAQITGIVAAMTGLFASIANLYKAFTKDGIREAAQKKAMEMASEGASKQAIDTMLNEALEAVSGSIIDRALYVGQQYLYNGLSHATDSILETSKKLINFTEQAFNIYRNYDQNFGEMADLEESIKNQEEELARLQELNEENATNKFLILGDNIYSHSMGSYDAIAELNIKIEKSIGGYYSDADPVSRIT